MRKAFPLLAAAAMALLAAGPALAHPGHDGASLSAGLLHPFSGWDHMLAMIAVGLWAALRGGKAQMVWPAAFVAAMLAGYGLGVAAPGLVLIEPGVQASVIVLGLLVFAAARAPLAAGAALVGLFGLMHGYAHGAEAPASAGLLFPCGFAIATAVLHLVGLGAGKAALALNRPALLRVLGGVVALGGLAMTLAGA